MKPECFDSTLHRLSPSSFSIQHKEHVFGGYGNDLVPQVLHGGIHEAPHKEGKSWKAAEEGKENKEMNG